MTSLERKKPGERVPHLRFRDQDSAREVPIIVLVADYVARKRRGVPSRWKAGYTQLQHFTRRHVGSRHVDIGGFKVRLERISGLRIRSLEPQEIRQAVFEMLHDFRDRLPADLEFDETVIQSDRILRIKVIRLECCGVPLLPWVVRTEAGVVPRKPPVASVVQDQRGFEIHRREHENADRLEVNSARPDVLAPFQLSHVACQPVEQAFGTLRLTNVQEFSGLSPTQTVNSGRVGYLSQICGNKFRSVHIVQKVDCIPQESTWQVELQLRVAAPHALSAESNLLATLSPTTRASSAGTAFPSWRMLSVQDPWNR